MRFKRFAIYELVKRVPLSDNSCGWVVDSSPAASGGYWKQSCVMKPAFSFFSGIISTAIFSRSIRSVPRCCLYGKVEMGMKGGKWMIHPDMELLEEDDETARILPIYNKTTEMTVGAMRRLVHGAVATHIDFIPDSLPQEMKTRLQPHEVE